MRKLKAASQTVVEKQLRFDSENILAQLFHEFQEERIVVVSFDPRRVSGSPERWQQLRASSSSTRPDNRRKGSPLASAPYKDEIHPRYLPTPFNLRLSCL